MSHRIKVMDVELSEPLRRIQGLAGYTKLKALLRWRGEPLDFIELPVYGDECPAVELRKALLSEPCDLLAKILRTALAHEGRLQQFTPNELLSSSPQEETPMLPELTVAICTRDRPRQLAECLKAMQNLKVAPREILVVDNAPRTDATERVAAQFPNVRYVLEPRPGLDWARNRAIAEAQGEIIAFTDDDVRVDSRWTEAIAKLFAANPEVMAVTGLVLPYELETEAQQLFEEYGGFSRGFDRKWFHTPSAPERSVAREYVGAGKFGTGANMAYRRELFARIGEFDPALDVGTVTQGGGDLDMFFRVLKSGQMLVYEPAAIVWHRHRQTRAELKQQIASNGVGFYSFLARTASAYREERKGVLRFAWWWFKTWNLRRWLISYVRPGRLPRELITAELAGSVRGLFRYSKAKREAARIAAQFGSHSSSAETSLPTPPENALNAKARQGVAVREVSLDKLLGDLNDISDYAAVRVFVTRRNVPLGHVLIENQYQPVRAGRLADAISQQIGYSVLLFGQDASLELAYSKIVAEFTDWVDRALVDSPAPPAALSPHTSVSIVVATCDRPDDLHNCLASLSGQVSPRPIELIVVDNRPESGVTPAVVACYPGVKLVSEPRPGLSYARNAGFSASSGQILIATDDDVVAPPDWVEKIVAPFVRNDVMIVTGNVLPLELETGSQLDFETYGGLGRGFERKEANREWFDSFRRRAVPTWELGATANTAIRASLLHEVGLMDEALGAGMPTGCSEDTCLFYRALKAGHTIVYEPSAHVWHRHRADLRSLHRQIYNYSKGHVAYHLGTLLRHGDLRALTRLGAELPLTHLRRLMNWLAGDRSYPLALIRHEIVGNLMGPVALWQARRRVNRLGRSAPYLPRAASAQPAPEAASEELTMNPALLK
jgi:O-antigen biosynthesis protein